jgi:hypothetical protein
VEQELDCRIALIGRQPHTPPPDIALPDTVTSMSDKNAST